MGQKHQLGQSHQPLRRVAPTATAQSRTLANSSASVADEWKENETSGSITEARLERDSLPQQREPFHFWTFELLRLEWKKPDFFWFKLRLASVCRLTGDFYYYYYYLKELLGRFGSFTSPQLSNSPKKKQKKKPPFKFFGLGWVFSVDIPTLRLAPRGSGGVALTPCVVVSVLISNGLFIGVGFVLTGWVFWKQSSRQTSAHQNFYYLFIPS